MNDKLNHVTKNHPRIYSRMLLQQRKILVSEYFTRRPPAPPGLQNCLHICFKKQFQISILNDFFLLLKKWNQSITPSTLVSTMRSHRRTCLPNPSCALIRCNWWCKLPNLVQGHLHVKCSDVAHMFYAMPIMLCDLCITSQQGPRHMHGLKQSNIKKALPDKLQIQPLKACTLHHNSLADDPNLLQLIPIRVCASFLLYGVLMRSLCILVAFSSPREDEVLPRWGNRLIVRLSFLSNYWLFQGAAPDWRL